ncbi:MAG: hypothetical protein MPK62_01690 [Alphaproteobacteria bacterium]|nr:hypothetical protein [Alphaproteobacteria bacterium]MDA8029845.1 hypothetical protein [Alphaproteobacteria bacterium]
MTGHGIYSRSRAYVESEFTHPGKKESREYLESLGRHNVRMGREVERLGAVFKKYNIRYGAMITSSTNSTLVVMFTTLGITPDSLAVLVKAGLRDLLVDADEYRGTMQIRAVFLPGGAA